MQKLIILLSFLFLTAPILAQTPSAMITNVQGPAIVVIGEKRISAQAMATLAPQTLIELRGGATMTAVFFATDSIEEYSGPALIGIGKNRGQVFHGDPSARKVRAVNSDLVRSIDPHALTEMPGNGSLSVARSEAGTTLSWNTDLAGPYSVTVIKPAQNNTARTVVWSAETANKNVPYAGPELDPALTYFVTVKAGSTVIGDSLFRVHNGKVEPLSAALAEAEKMSQAKPKDATPHVLMSTAYAQHGMHDKSVNSMQYAINAQPDEDAFIGRMKTMMGQVNKTAEDHTAYARGYYEARENWGTDTYYDPHAWRWEDGWDD